MLGSLVRGGFGFFLCLFCLFYGPEVKPPTKLKIGISGKWEGFNCHENMLDLKEKFMCTVEPLIKDHTDKRLPLV